jgi:HEAT repeat protein
MKQSGYVDHISTLVPLKDDKTYELSLVPDAKVHGRAASAILVKSKGQPDVRLYFDRDTGLLQKTEYRCPDMRKKEVLREEYLSDYRDVNPAAADEQTLQAAQVPADGPALLDFLRRRTLDEARRDKIEMLIKKLGDNSFEVRQRAKEAIVGEGAVTLPLLTKYLRDPDPEIAGRAKECLQQIAKPSPDVSLAAAVVRLVAQRRPAGATKALLAYLPNAPDDVVAAEVRTALAAIAYQDGKPDPVLTQALEDKETGRRAAAAVALGRDESDREARTERVFLRGLKRAMKGVEYRDGKKSMEWELTDVQYFKRLGNAVFAKP